MNIFNDITELIGNTKLFYLHNYCKKNAIKAKLCVKLEASNPAGSIKDRAAAYMIKDAEEKGILKPGATIIEPTSGNTGIALAAIGRARGYKVILTMPDTMSSERINLLKAFGAELVLTDGSKGMTASIEKANELHRLIDGSIIAGQFDNVANPEAHYRSTGPEIWNDTDGKIKAFVAGIGTGGTLSGTARYLKEKNPDIKIVGVEPSASPMISQGVSAPHKLQGIGANFIPQNYDSSVCDEIYTVDSEKAYSVGREIAETEGILLGISSAAAISAAHKYSEKLCEGEIIVAIAPDGGERYLSVENYLI